MGHFKATLGPFEGILGPFGAVGVPPGSRLTSSQRMNLLPCTNMAGTRGGSNGSGTGTGRGAAMTAPGREGEGGRGYRGEPRGDWWEGGKGGGAGGERRAAIGGKREMGGVRGGAHARMRPGGAEWAWLAAEMGVSTANGGAK